MSVPPGLIVIEAIAAAVLAFSVTVWPAAMTAFSPVIGTPVSQVAGLFHGPSPTDVLVCAEATLARNNKSKGSQ